MRETVEFLGERVSVREQRTRLRMIIAETWFQRELNDMVDEDLEKASRRKFHSNYPEIETSVARAVIFFIFVLAIAYNH